jgi:tetrahydromethanopterin S-methyltransferase subunit C
MRLWHAYVALVVIAILALAATMALTRPLPACRAPANDIDRSACAEL